MSRREKSGKKESGRPESDSGGKCELHIAAKRKFLGQSHGQESEGPLQGRKSQSRTVRVDSNDSKSVEQEDHKKNAANREKSPQQPFPKIFWEGGAPRAHSAPAFGA